MTSSTDIRDTQELLPDGIKDVRSHFKRPDSSENSKSRLTSRAYVFALHAVLSVLVLLLWRTSRHDADCVSLKDRSWSPVNRFVKYETNTQLAPTYDRHSVYSGSPTDEQDEAWHALIQPDQVMIHVATFFNASRQELTMAGESMDEVVEASDGGYLAALGVYHEIHCLSKYIKRRLRLWLYRDRYHPNITDAEVGEIKEHLDHCLESLRLTVMCHGNTALYSFSWKTRRHSKPGIQSGSRSVCVDWGSIRDWAYSRRLPFPPSYVPPTEDAQS
ncbi:hypothetical protein CP532_1298 [Ophiocordyceps camponoti-leonardi (nom. inval.)]|nr:hypothetical protein CP532_1298 [Ophiocordyceps camponoti-leonardi (nom. inval.)]